MDGAKLRPTAKLQNNHANLQLALTFPGTNHLWGGELKYSVY